MELIGMLDSPFVRRVAVAMLKTGVPFTHRPISLFRHIEAFSSVSPLLKAPSLIAKDGKAIVESGVILGYLEHEYPSLAALRPQSLPAYRAMGVALTVMEKSVQLHYERALRSPQQRSETWVARVTGQLSLGLAALESDAPDGWFDAQLTHADIAVACAWSFVGVMIGDLVDATPYPRLAAFTARAEALPEFRAAPPVDGATVESLS